jgi:hypothetical protein
MTKLLAVAAMAFGVAVLPARAFAAGAPEKLSDAQLDDVTGGAPPAFAMAGGRGHSMGNQAPTVIGTQVVFNISDVTLVFNVGSNSDVNLAAALQLSILSQAPQAASATAAQQATHH